MWASYKKSLQAAFLVVFCLALGLHGHAQSSSVSISGTILDPTGAVVANAAVVTRSATLTDQPPRMVPGSSVSQTFHLIPTI